MDMRAVIFRGVQDAVGVNNENAQQEYASVFVPLSTRLGTLRAIITRPQAMRGEEEFKKAGLIYYHVPVPGTDCPASVTVGSKTISVTSGLTRQPRA